MHAELAAVPSSLYNITRANRVIAVVRIEDNQGSHGDDSKTSTTCFPRPRPRPDRCRTVDGLAALAFGDNAAVPNFTRIGINTVVAD
jgi:hypothetical protein